MRSSQIQWIVNALRQILLDSSECVIFYTCVVAMKQITALNCNGPLLYNIPPHMNKLFLIIT